MRTDRDALITEHLEWARNIAAHVASMLPTWFTQDDLIGPAELELVRLAAKYDASRDVSFKVFAQRRLYGACFDSIRRSEYKEREHEDIDDFEPLCPLPGPFALAVDSQRSGIWARVQRLPRRHALVILAFYAGDMSLVEIGDLVGLCKQRMCQIHREALKMLADTCEDLDVAA